MGDERAKGAAAVFGRDEERWEGRVVAEPGREVDIRSADVIFVIVGDFEREEGGEV